MKEAWDLYCDAAGCRSHARVLTNGPGPLLVLQSPCKGHPKGRRSWSPLTDPQAVIPPGWGRLQFQSDHAVIELDHCPRHLADIVLPWIERLGALEAEDLGIPTTQGALALPPPAPAPAPPPSTLRRPHRARTPTPPPGLTPEEFEDLGPTAWSDKAARVA